MRILAIYRHYWPDTTPYARLLKEILETLAAEGHSVTVFTAQPSYNDTRQSFQPRRQTVNGVEVLRMPLLPERKWIRPLWGLNLLLFLSAAVMYLVFRRRYELVIANTYPPMLMGCTLRIAHALTGVRYIYHCQDLHPETMALSGALKRGRFYRFLQRLDAKTCETAEATIVLSRDMLGTFRERGQDCCNVEVINNFPLGLSGEEPAELPAELKHPGAGQFRVVFTGNIGNFQALDVIISAAGLLRDRPNIQFVFVGGGAAKAKLIRQAGDLVGRTVRFIPYQPLETAFAVLKQADLGIVSLRPEMYRLAFPSKCMMYLAAGCPLLAVIEPESELSELIHTYGLGYVSSHTPEEIAAAILNASNQASVWSRQRRTELAAQGDALFGQATILERWRQLFRRRFPDQTNTVIASQTCPQSVHSQLEAA